MCGMVCVWCGVCVCVVCVCGVCVWCVWCDEWYVYGECGMMWCVWHVVWSVWYGECGGVSMVCGEYGVW